VGLERGPLSLVSTVEELLGKKKSRGSGLESRITAVDNPLHLRRDTLYPQELALTSSISLSICASVLNILPTNKVH
jgi:hypothetical protein